MPLTQRTNWKSNLSSKNNWLLLAALFCVYFYYFITSAGINCSNDGGHMALASSIYNDHQVSVENHQGTLVLEPDYAVKNGVIYSDRLPGNAFLIMPFLIYADITSSIIPENWAGNKNYNIKASVFNPNDTSGKSSNFDIIVSTLLPNICGIVGLYLMFLICSNIFLFSFRLSLMVILIIGLSTLIHLESTHLFSHAPSMLCVTISVTIALYSKNSTNYRGHIWAMSAVIGLATIIELQNILFFIPLFLYIIVTNQFAQDKKTSNILKTVSVSILILGFFITVLLLYNYIVFDEWILKSNKYNPFFPEEKSFQSALSGNPLYGIDRLFTNLYNISSYFNWSNGTSNETPALFASNPVFIFSALGFIPFFKQRRKECILFISIIAISVLIASFHITTLVRHIFTIHILLFLPMIFFFNSLKSLDSRKRTIAYILIIVVTLLSFFRQAYLTNHYFRLYDFGTFPYLKNTLIFLTLNIPVFAAILYRTKILTGIFNKNKLD